MKNLIIVESVRNVWIGLVILTLMLVMANFNIVHAGCIVGVNPSEVLAGDYFELDVSIQNTGENPIRFVSVPTGLGGFVTINNTEVAGWDLSLIGGANAYLNGTINGGGAGVFRISGTAGYSITNFGWTWSVSENTDGSGAFDCNQVLVDVVSELTQPDPTPTPEPPPGISAVSVSAGASSATISWKLDKAATGVVRYGTTTQYGQSVTTEGGDAERVVLSGLSASTTYHYQISVTGVGGTTIVEDNSFVTAAAGTTSVITTTVVNTVVNTLTSTVTQVREVKDTTAPVVTLGKLENKVVKAPPVVEGVARDSSGVWNVTYSLDGGKNWSETLLDGERGDKRVGFMFEPEVEEDGTYIVKIRALDVATNVSREKEIEFVLDAKVPVVGPGKFWRERLKIIPDINGDLVLPVGTSVRIVVPEVGGADGITFIGNSKQVEAKELGLGIWEGGWKVENLGREPLKVTAIDGAGNRTERLLINIVGVKAGRVISPIGQVVKGAMISIKSLDDLWGDFKLWRGESWELDNLVKTDENGEYGLVLPKGSYYLEVRGGGFSPIRSDIFRVENTRVINQEIVLRESDFSWWTKLSSFAGKYRSFEMNLLPQGQTMTEVKKKFPFEKLKYVKNDNLKATKVLVDSFRMGSEVMMVNDQYVVGLLDGYDRVELMSRRGDFEGVVMADESGELMKLLKMWTLPTLLNLDDEGNIMTMEWGVNLYDNEQ